MVDVLGQVHRAEKAGSPASPRLLHHYQPSDGPKKYWIGVLVKVKKLLRLLSIPTE